MGVFSELHGEPAPDGEEPSVVKLYLSPDYPEIRTWQGSPKCFKCHANMDGKPGRVCTDCLDRMSEYHLQKLNEEEQMKIINQVQKEIDK